MTQEQKTIFLVLLSTFYFLFSVPSFAAEVNVIPLNWEVGVDRTLEIDISFSTEGEFINAISGEVGFPQDILELEEIKDGSSIISFWVEKPRREENRIVFAGIVPGGFNGENGLLFSLVFRTKKEGSGVIELRHMESFLNDGEGTPAPLKLFQLAFAVKKEGVITQPPRQKDSEPPEAFVPEIAREASVFDGKWFLVFATQDKGAGIDRYEIRETKLRIFQFLSPWTPAESPYLLKDQELRSFILVKAVDKAGNERILKVPPRNPVPWYTSYEIWIMIVIVTALLLFPGGRKLWRAHATT